MTTAGVSVATDNPSAMNINLWVDTSGDGQFFAFTGTHYDGLNGDSYGSYGSYGNTTLLTGASTRAFFTPPASGYTTLAALQAAYPNAAVAIWAGITNAGGHADISGITVTDNSPAPEPASMVLLGGGLIGIGVLLKRKRAAD